ncbi:MAG: T9SS type A sorting domain-containing protein [Bacteroidales bacterium]|nr:T9SS type A sorting domain-containing protein [Bacteroidales bacterium]MDI9592068.1 T9SS type A sorting domain-containing protein [Bacteroidota bacterium]HOF80736.1 T9SS type A sorting domain-containing protein [Bacteroidales bacterium]HOR76080.1 T9SS type A sorting domain-containing protein [Bacteroidales bacterium]HPL11523.1 T9SS type A sorting domain-containing protein [Bacteroidales bacterium]
MRYIFNFRVPTTFSYLVVIILFSCQTSVFSQITITQNDMPSAGDTVRKSFALDFTGIDFSVTGENYLWDFSQLKPASQTVDTFVTVSSVPFLYQLVFIPNIVANVAQKYTGLENFPQVPITDPYRFYKKSSNAFNDVGYAATISGIPVPLRLNPADVIYKLPLAYGNIDSSDASGQLGVPDIGYVSIQRKRLNEVDGWGTLITPYGEYDVLRLKSSVMETDSVYVDTLNFGQQIVRKYTEYKWLTNGKKQPLLEVTEENAIMQVTYIDSIFDPGVGIEKADIRKPKIYIAPNPITDKAIIVVELSEPEYITISLINMAGIRIKRVFSGNLPAGKHFQTLNLSDSKPASGVYLIQVEWNGKSTAKRLIIQ